MGVDTAASDRLPWLADEPARKPPKQRRRRNLLPMAAAGAVLAAAAAIWIGLGTAHHSAPPEARHAAPSMTVHLPPPHMAAPPEVRMPETKEVRPVPATDVRPVAPREVHIAAPPHRGPVAREQTRERRPVEGVTTPRPSRGEPGAPGPQASTKSPATAAPFVLPRPWNPRIVSGAAGRLVQVGAFGSVRQAKRGWWFMVRAYPAMAHLPAVVRPAHNSNGQLFFRFRVGTTSQAHSEILCQRMVAIHLSCAVVGLPWKATVER